MRTPVQAMLWELWRLTRWEFILRGLMMALMGCGVFFFGARIVQLVQAVETLTLDTTGIYLPLMVPVLGMSFVLCLFTGVWMNSLDHRVTGFAFRLGYARPVTTPLLVGLPMVFITLLTGVTYLVPAMVIRWFFPVPFPLVSMATVIMTMCATFIMAVWSAPRTIPRTLAFFAAMGTWALIGVLWARRHSDGLDPLSASPAALEATFSFSPLQYTLLLACYTSAIVVTIIMVERQRHGDGFEPFTLSRLVAPRNQEAADSPRPFSGPYRAQFWFEMRRAGVPVIGIGALCAVGTFVFLTVLGLFDDVDRNGILALWFVFAAIAPAALQMTGVHWLLGLRIRGGVGRLSAFEATRAVDGNRLLLLKFLVLSMGVLAGCLFMLAAGLTWAVLFDAFPPWQEIHRALDPGSSIHVASLVPMMLYVLAVLYIAVSALLYTAGLLFAHRPRPFVAVPFALMGYVVLWAWDSQHGWRLKPFWEAHAWLVAGALVAAAYLTLRTCVKREYFSAKFVAGLLFAWALYLYVLAQIATSLPFDEPPLLPLPVIALALATLTVPLSAIALAPISLAAHRHA